MNDSQVVFCMAARFKNDNYEDIVICFLCCFSVIIKKNEGNTYLINFEERIMCGVAMDIVKKGKKTISSVFARLSSLSSSPTHPLAFAGNTGVHRDKKAGVQGKKK
ncbi:MAG: hypothetical protein SD837_19130 [Candidatus Electrothrix scaldis]|nr:MAG: hypothetical protein SD837_19130 [Candidatus Electrothrix sp. GW3-3]